MDIFPELSGELASRLMAVWPGLEVKAEAGFVSFTLPVDREIDRNLELLEQTLKKLEEGRNLPDLGVRCVNRSGPDSAGDNIQAGCFLIVQPGGDHISAPDKIVMTIDPGAAFGTGGHPSTRLSLAAMEEYFNPGPGAPSRQGARVLDTGTGSGILAVAAGLSGAGCILAVDPDREAAAAACRNASINGLESIMEFQETTADRIDGEFDLILANLVLSVLLRSCKKLVPRLAPEGTLILSGFADSQTPQVVKAVTKLGLVSVKSYSLDGWGALALIRSDL